MKRFAAGLALLFLAITGCSAQETASSTPHIYPPLIYVNDCLYHDLGRFRAVTKLPDGWILWGEVEQRVPQTEEIPEENFTSNSLDPGTELFANETDDTKIYAKLEEKYYLLYEQVIEEDADS